MSCGRKVRALQVCLVAAALACAGVLVVEARRDAGARNWFGLSAGLGLGSQAGIDGGFFAYDARLESLPDSALSPLVGSPLGAGGVFTFAPFCAEVRAR